MKELGFDFHSAGGVPYWNDQVYYSFSINEIEEHIEVPTEELVALCLEFAGKAVNSEEILEELFIPQFAWDHIRNSWKRGEATLYGRFDFAYDGKGPAKMLEYNADTPTSLYEAAVFQWVWLEDRIAAGVLPAGADQFNSIHEKLIERFQGLGRQRFLHLSGLLDSIEDKGTLAYIEDCARQAGHGTQMLAMEDVGLRGDGVFVDLEDRPISWMFKLYPWEWLWADEFGKSPAMKMVNWLEPPWKAVLFNKGLLPHLWRMAPGHPNLLPAYFEYEPEKSAPGTRFAKKPIYSREGANILLVDGETVAGRTGGDYGHEGYVRQALVQLPEFDGRYPVIGSWVIGESACGMGIREDASLITSDLARFLPHAIIG
ncbi:MAG: glutathionylspermidine synthase family protein [Alphaproteobacteria bacterium]|nr:glutathionylspermidine synthase family protein [Alphaproteobacteria bacterium]